ncbi:MAG: sulfatase-like hydrolase/transferase [Caldilineaceae bacterium]
MRSRRRRAHGSRVIAGVARAQPAASGSPNVIFFVLNATWATARCPPSADWSTHQTSTGWSRTGYATPTSIPPRSARPPAPASSAGRNHHSNGVAAAIMETATGYPSCRDSRMPFENGMLSEMLLERSYYSTFCTGKWHLSPAEESTPASPFHRWPLGRSFERFYGFLGGETNQWFPDLTYDNHSVPQPKTVEEGYHLDEDLIDHTIQFILDAHVNAPDQPSSSTTPRLLPRPIRSARSGSRSTGQSSTWAGTNTAIVFARQEGVGIFSSRPTPKLVPARSRRAGVGYTDRPAKSAVRTLHEVFAGFLEHAFSSVSAGHAGSHRRVGEHTLIALVIPDNGAGLRRWRQRRLQRDEQLQLLLRTFGDILPKMDQSGAGRRLQPLPWGWSWAGNTPFRRWKKEVFRGGSTIT